MKRRVFIRRDEEGVSPVIATILMVAITVVLAAVLYLMSRCATLNPIPIGVWCDETVDSATKVTVEFGEMSRIIRPINLEFILIINETTAARYGFSSNTDERLVLKNGTDIGTLTFENHGDKMCVDAGDRMILTNLAPNSEYILKMIWAPTGDEMDSIAFSTTSV